VFTSLCKLIVPPGLELNKKSMVFYCLQHAGKLTVPPSGKSNYIEKPVFSLSLLVDFGRISSLVGVLVDGDECVHEFTAILSGSGDSTFFIFKPFFDYSKGHLYLIYE